MNTLVLKVSGMSCMGCVNNVKKMLSALAGVGEIQVDLVTATVAVTHDDSLVSAARIKAAIEDGGYQVETPA